MLLANTYLLTYLLEDLYQNVCKRTKLINLINCECSYINPKEITVFINLSRMFKYLKKVTQFNIQHKYLMK